MTDPLDLTTDPTPTHEQIARILADAPDIGPEIIRQAGEHVDYLTAMAKSWIINGDEHHGAMLQTLTIAFGYQQTDIERLKVENVNLRARLREAREQLATKEAINEQLKVALDRSNRELSAHTMADLHTNGCVDCGRRVDQVLEATMLKNHAEEAAKSARRDALLQAADDIDLMWADVSDEVNKIQAAATIEAEDWLRARAGQQ